MSNCAGLQNRKVKQPRLPLICLEAVRGLVALKNVTRDPSRLLQEVFPDYFSMHWPLYPLIFKSIFSRIRLRTLERLVLKYGLNVI